MIIDTRNWRWPQWAVIGMAVAEMICGAMDDGKPQQYYLWQDFLSNAIFIFVLIKGNFFNSQPTSKS